MKKVFWLCVLLLKQTIHPATASPSRLPIGHASRDSILPIDNDSERIERRRPRWLESISNKIYSIAANERTFQVLQVGIVAYLVVEIFNGVKNAVEEILHEEDFTGISNNNRAVSNADTKKILAWLNQGPTEKIPIPNISNPWLISAALTLKHNTRMSMQGLEHLLSKLTKPQATLLQTCLLQPDEKKSFDSIGGLSRVKRCIQDSLPVNTEETLNLPKTPYDDFVNEGRKGIVLWGPPGCGKSLLIQAIAQKTRLPTLVVTPSLIQAKYFGESTNKVRSLFGLVSALGPCIVVLDELDGLFKARKDDELEASRDLKTEWLQWWDGVASAQMERNKVTIIAATNHPWACDPAVWRRLPQRYYVGVPNYDDRVGLLQLWRDIHHLPPVDDLVMEHFARVTEGYVPSDLHQIFQSACRRGPMARQDETLTDDDVNQALAETPPTRFTVEYVQQLQAFLSTPGQPQSNQLQGTPMGGNGQYIQTPTGNYYQLQIPVDSDVVDALNELLWSAREWDSSDYSEYDDNDDDFDEDEI
eukprot:scaffold1525_cov142-Cylindrotheca_fusiformis.AAC.180